MVIYIFITIDFQSVDIRIVTRKKNEKITEEPKWKRRGKFVPKVDNIDPSKVVHSAIFSTYFQLVR